MFLKEVSYAYYQGCSYMIKNIVKTVIFKMTVLYFRNHSDLVLKKLFF